MAKRVTLEQKALVNTLEEADATLARIAELERHITLVNTGLQDDIARLQLVANEQLSDVQQEKEKLEQALVVFGKANKDALFTETQRSRALTFGTIGLSKTPPALDTIGSTPWKRVLQLLEEKDLAQYIRTQKEVNKEALEGASPEVLKSVRCRIKTTEKFYYRLKDHAEGGAA